MTALQPPPTDERSSRPVTPAADQIDPNKPTSYVTGIADGNLATPVRLRDYLVGVGVVFRLSKRDRRKEEREAAAVEAAKPRIQIPVKKLMMALAPALVAYLGYLAWDTFSGDPLPTEVSGTWSTDDGKYKGRNFWINPEAVAFQNGKTADDFSIHPIKKVSSHQVADTLFLAIDYEQEGKAITLSLAYRDIPSPEIRLVNQPAIRWLKTGAAPVISQ
jgi:hypothetical protein